ncbi:hypothetical protein [Streptomyces justiciae]|uniref:hypothetical protein n=1 Tax=Streptomyces justiciae TaxID=2780140 RepID=UPI00188061EE|nr:hypothetical protein [Streptomyces justiciae]MBE8473823.1 hypothetical protein [Streptomyces justiciae]
MGKISRRNEERGAGIVPWEERVAVAGTYTVEVMGYSVPSGSTAYDYHETYFSSAIGSVTVHGPPSVKLGTGGSTTASADVTVAAAPSAGREVFAEVRLRSAGGATVGVGGMKIEKVTP